MNDARRRMICSSRLLARHSAVAAALALACLAPAHASARMAAPWGRLARTIHAQAPNIGIKAISVSLDAYFHARQRHLTDKPLLTIVDYSEPSAKRRLAVADVQTGKVLFYTYVAHGKGSGLDYATHFSNQPGSDASSLGVYLTGQTYNGEHGYSLRLHGLSPHFNGAAYRRDIVVHSAWYVSRAFAREHGRMGRSWGCFALSRRVESAVVKLIRNGTVLVGYYPDPKWLEFLPFLKAGLAGQPAPSQAAAAVRLASLDAPRPRPAGAG